MMKNEDENMTDITQVSQTRINLRGDKGELNNGNKVGDNRRVCVS